MTCPICNSKNIKSFCRQENIPVLQNLLFDSYNEAINCNIGNIDLFYCYNCSFIYNQKFDINLVKYSDKYENSQFSSGYFKSYIDEIINYILGNFRNINGVLEIGCGNGEFLKILSKKLSNTILYGFDKALKENYKKENLNFYNSYYSNSISLDFNLTILRHVLEHIYNPLNFLKENIHLSENFFIEIPSFEWILENNAYWDIFYEHCNYFTEKSIFYLLDKIGFSNIEIIKQFNNQYLWIINSSNNIKREFAELDIDTFSKNKYDFIERSKEFIEKNRCYIWGAGAKGISYCNYLDPDNKFIEGIIDINPKKKNKYCPKTGHKVISQFEINNNIEYIIIMNSNYKNEIIEYIKRIDYSLLKKLIEI